MKKLYEIDIEGTGMTFKVLAGMMYFQYTLRVWTERQLGDSTESLLRSLRSKFKIVPDDRRAQIQAATYEQVECWLGRVAEASSMDEVFDETIVCVPMRNLETMNREDMQDMVMEEYEKFDLENRAEMETQGIMIGVSDGFGQGVGNGMAEALLRHMRRRFQSVSTREEALVRSASLEELEALMTRMSEGSSLASLFDSDEEILEGAADKKRSMSELTTPDKRLAEKFDERPWPAIWLKGWKQGWEAGLAQGKFEGRLQVLEHLALERFETELFSEAVSAEQQSLILDATIKQLDVWLDCIYDSESIAALLKQ